MLNLMLIVKEDKKGVKLKLTCCGQLIVAKPEDELVVCYACDTIYAVAEVEALVEKAKTSLSDLVKGLRDDASHSCTE